MLYIGFLFFIVSAFTSSFSMEQGLPNQDPFLQKKEFKKLKEARNKFLYDDPQKGILVLKCLKLLTAYLDVAPIICQQEFLANDTRKLYAFKIITDFNRLINEITPQPLYGLNDNFKESNILDRTRKSLEEFSKLELKIQQDLEKAISE